MVMHSALLFAAAAAAAAAAIPPWFARLATQSSSRRVRVVPCFAQRAVRGAALFARELPHGTRVAAHPRLVRVASRRTGAIAPTRRRAAVAEAPLEAFAVAVAPLLASPPPASRRTRATAIRVLAAASAVAPGWARRVARSCCGAAETVPPSSAWHACCCVLPRPPTGGAHGTARQRARARVRGLAAHAPETRATAELGSAGLLSGARRGAAAFCGDSTAHTTTTTGGGGGGGGGGGSMRLQLDVARLRARCGEAPLRAPAVALGGGGATHAVPAGGARALAVGSAGATQAVAAGRAPAVALGGGGAAHAVPAGGALA